MNIYDAPAIGRRLQGNPYVGRGIVIGKSRSGKQAAVAYFIMGRSENSRNRIFVEREDGVFTEPYDPSKVQDPSLIIYAALRSLGRDLIVTNGDQTDTIYRALQQGGDFRSALAERSFEPDAPNLTPRISGILHFHDGDFTYEMSILKSVDAQGSACCRYTFDYPAAAGLGHFLHTYVTDGDPLPTFQGEPERVAIPDDMEEFARDIWNHLDPDNKISLYVRYVDLESGQVSNCMVNKNGH